MGKNGIVVSLCAALGGKAIGYDDGDRAGAHCDWDLIGGRRPARFKLFRRFVSY
jgi:hypothetical protein